MHTDIAALAQRLVRVPGVTGQEGDIAREYCAAARALGLQAETDAVGNVIVRKPGHGSGPRLALSGHLDTVPADPSRWTVPPHAGLIRDGMLYGRGAADMRGMLAVLLAVAAETKRAGETVIIATAGEELYEGATLGPALDAAAPDILIIGEATECELAIAQRGRAEYDVRAYGVPTHASHGKTAANPVEQLAALVSQLRELPATARHPLCGERVIVPTDIGIVAGGGLDGRGGNSTVPAEAYLTVEVRTLPGDSEEMLTSLLQQQAQAAVAGLPAPPRALRVAIAETEFLTWTGARLAVRKHAPAWETAADMPAIVAVQQALRAAGQAGTLRAFSFCTDASAAVAYRQRHPEARLTVFGYGAGREDAAHRDDEHIAIAALQQAAHGLLAISNAL